MPAFRQHRGVSAPLLLANVDTDAIIPSREMTRVSKRGLGDGLFANWRYRNQGSRVPEPGFILNQKPFDRATILLTLENFGCGSSREFAVWALLEFGIRAIIAPSFGAIFQKNCITNGILTAVISEDGVRRLADWVVDAPARRQIEIDLPARLICFGGNTVEFSISDADREYLMRELDAIDETLAEVGLIEAFEARHFSRHPEVVIEPED